MPKEDKASAILRLDSKTRIKGSDYGEVEESLMKLEGVLSARVNHVANTVSVEFDPHKLKLEDIRKKLNNV
jgi:copper chaperone CopZ